MVTFILRIGITLLFFTNPVHAFTVIASKVKGWNQDQLNFIVNSSQCPISDSELFEHLESAIGLWNSVSSSHLTLTLEESSSEIDFDELSSADSDAFPDPVIVCDPNCSSNAGMNCSGIPAYAEVSFNSKRQINFAYITLNAEEDANSNLEELSDENPDIIPIVLAHEMGHVLGLGHATSENALMYYNLTKREELTLSEDDVLGVSYLYPVTEPSSDGAFGCAPSAEARGLNATRGGSQPWWRLLLNGVGQLWIWVLLVWSLPRLTRGSR